MAAELTGRRPAFPLVILATGVPMFMATLDNLVMTNALPVIHVDLGATVEELQWFINAYTLAFAGVILLAVALGDRVGRRNVFIAGIALFTLASVAAALSTDPTQLILARTVQGVGGAGIMPLSLSLLAGAVDERRRPLAIGIWGGVAGLGVAAGPLVGGAVVEGWDWHAIFWLNVPVGLIAIPLALLVLPAGTRSRLPIDVVGMLLAALGVLGIVYGIVRGNDAGWGSAEVIGALVLGAGLLATFIGWERRNPAPLLPLRLFRDRSFAIANVVGLGFSFGIFGAVFILIQYLQVVQGASPLQAAVQTMPWTTAPMVVAPLAGLVAPRVGTRLLIVTGLMLQAGALGWLGLTIATDTAYGEMLPAFLAAGIGMSLVFAPSSTAVLANITEADTAKASGTNSTMREIGTALGIAVLTAVFTGAGGELTPTGYVAAAQPAVLVGAVALTLTAAAALLLPAGRSHIRRAAEPPLTATPHDLESEAIPALTP